MKKKKEMSLKELAQNLFANAQQHFPDDLVGALNSLKLVAEYNPDHPNIQRWIGFTHLCLGEFEQSVEFLKAALQDNPDDRMAAAHLITVLCTLARCDEAESLVIRFLQMYPYNSHLHYLRAETLKTKGLLDLAEDSYNTALDYDPKHIGALLNLASLYYEQQEFEEAEKLYKRALRAKPYYLQAAQNLGILYFVWGKYKPMQRTARRITKIRFKIGDLPPINTLVY